MWSRRQWGRACAWGVMAAAMPSLRAQTASAPAPNGPTPPRGATRLAIAVDHRASFCYLPLTIAEQLGYFKAEGLDVTIDTGNGSREAIPRVASGTYDVGFGDVNSLIRFRDENPTVDLKSVMMIYDKPPFSIVGRKSRGITAEVKSLEGKKFGAPAADAAFAQWPIFKAVNKIDDSKMKFENVGFPVREPMLASGEVDAVFGFAFSVEIQCASTLSPAKVATMILWSQSYYHMCTAIWPMSWRA